MTRTMALATVAVAAVVADHVQRCFAIESEVVQQIMTGAITTELEIDECFGRLTGAT
jgi:hypothetical protein